MSPVRVTRDCVPYGCPDCGVHRPLDASPSPDKSRQQQPMGDPFDPYREALVVETATVWPEELSHLGPAQRRGDPAPAARRSGPSRRNRIRPPRHGLLPPHHRDRRRRPASQPNLGIAVPSATQTVRVDLAERGYDIEIGADNLPEAGRFLDRPRQGVARHRHHRRERPAAARPARGRKPGRPEGRRRRGGRQAGRAVEVDRRGRRACGRACSNSNADRQTVVVAVGGGVVGDLAGFIAATYARGFRFLQVPTTLLAQVDSSVGGKVGINLPEAKNMVGAFLQPLGVLIDTATLDTLPPREYCAGLGEVVKYGVILDAELFDYLEAHAAELVQRDPPVLVHVIAQCCRLKADVVRRDEREESGQRAVLNYGHTFAHALETLSGYGTLLHGEAVAIGMDCAARLAEQLGRVDASFTERQRELLVALGLPVRLPKLDREKIVAAMMHDKKGAARPAAAGAARAAGPRGVGRRRSRRRGAQGPGAVAARAATNLLPSPFGRGAGGEGRNARIETGDVSPDSPRKMVELLIQVDVPCWLMLA